MSETSVAVVKYDVVCGKGETYHHVKVVTVDKSVEDTIYNITQQKVSAGCGILLKDVKFYNVKIK